MIIFIHGYGTSGKGGNAALLQSRFGKDEVYVPALKHKPLQDMQDISNKILDCFFEGEKVILVGSSLGGFYARILAAQFGVSAALINPAYTPSKGLTDYGTFTKFDCDEKFKWTKQENGDLRFLEENFKGKEESINKINFYVASDDELIDHSHLKGNFPFVKYFDNCGHRFLRFNEILDDIKNIKNKSFA